MTRAAERGQVSGSAADIYERFFLPALFAEWAPRLAERSAIGPGDRVLDVACGTGVAAREALARVAPGGRVSGLDCNPDMLGVAARIAPQVDWRAGTAQALPFGDASFDVALCQFGLMFFEDRAGALAEMWRVLRPGGRLAVATWAALPTSPGYAAMYALLQDLFGAEIAGALHAPFALGEADMLHALAREAGIAGATVETVAGHARFASLEDWLHTEIRGWTLADTIDDAGFERLLAAAPEHLGRFAGADGRISFAAPAHILSATRA